MPVPNRFEEAILNAAISAQRFHIEMSGFYLWYSHESYLQNYIAIKVFENQRFETYVDASPRKIRESSDSISKRPPSNDAQRFDLVFWRKARNQLKAIVEIKRAWNQTPVIKDVKKLSSYIAKKDAGGATGYVLYYTHGDTKLIINRFNRVSDTMRNQLNLHGLTHPVDSYICKLGEPPWGFALFRC